MDDLVSKPIKFRCPPELAADLPRPTPALLGLPSWFKAMPHVAFSALLNEEQMTVKKCPPFIDAMTYGFLMPLSADLRVEDGTFHWDREVPVGPRGCCGPPWIDDDDGPASVPLRLEVLHERGQRLDDVGAGEKDRRGLRDILQRKR